MSRTDPRSRPPLATLLASLVLLLAAPATAQQSDESVDPDALPPDVPRPDFMARRPTIPDFLLKDKREGFYFTAMPAIGYDTDTGFNIGAFVELYWNGSRDDPFFRTAPYRHLVFVGAVASTEGRTNAFVATDSLYVRDTPWRVRTQLGVEDNRAARYFGIGNDAMDPLFLPPVPNTSIPFRRFETYAGFEKEKDKAFPPYPGNNSGEQGFTYTKFDQYKLRRWYARLQLERDTFGGIVRPIFGVTFSYVGISDFTGKVLDAKDFMGGNTVDAVELPTLLELDCQRRKAIGCGGGWDNFLKLGVVYDTRDFEPDPRSGILAQAITELSTKILGSRFNYGRVVANVAGYYSPFPEKADVVLAGRLLFQYQWDAVPFYSLDNYPDSTDIRDMQGLGGIRTLRGYKQDRFIGPVTTLANAEIRWTFTEVTVWDQHLAFALTPFVDAGRVYDEPGDITVNDWAIGYGAGLTLKWNLSTVVRFDLGTSSEGETFYMELRHPF